MANKAIDELDELMVVKGHDELDELVVAFNNQLASCVCSLRT